MGDETQIARCASVISKSSTGNPQVYFGTRTTLFAFEEDLTP